jgi:2-polyprenyl-3-methyl-5-hydroxy-6-metoxy-1,4-benzoquinol methylase
METTYIRRVWGSHLKPVLRRGLYAAKQTAAWTLRQCLPILGKVLPPLARRMRMWEWVWQPVFSQRYFDKFYEQEDPFDFDSNPYETQKYATTLDLLKGEHFDNALEIGAAEGTFTEKLAPLCISLLAIEMAEPAVKRARERLKKFSHVTFSQAALPHQMPSGPFDLIVASDVLYYLPHDVMTASLDAIEAELMPGGIFFAIHYMGDFGQPMNGREVHDIMKKRYNMKVVHDETVFGEGPKASNGYAITIFRKQAA